MHALKVTMIASNQREAIQGDWTRAETRALIWGGGGEYSYIRVLPDEFLLKSVVFKYISKEISRAEHEYMNINSPPPPQLSVCCTFANFNSALHNNFDGGIRTT